MNKSDILKQLDNYCTMLESTMITSGDFRTRSNKESPDRVTRSKSLSFAKIGDVDLNEANQVRINFEVASSSYDSDGKTYNTMIVIPGLLGAFKENPKSITVANAIKNSDVQVKCQCDDFQYRFTHYLAQNNSLAPVGGERESNAIKNKPVDTRSNPYDDKGAFCKHLLKVTSVFGFNISNITSKLKGIDTTTKTESDSVVTEMKEGITLEKDNEFAKAVIDSPGGIDEMLSKDVGLDDTEREEIKEVFLEKDNTDVNILAVDDEDESDEIELEKEDELTLDEINNIEPTLKEGDSKKEGAIELSKDVTDVDTINDQDINEIELSKDSDTTDEDDTIELEKDTET